MALDGRDRRLLRLSVAVVLGRWEVLRELRRGAPAGEPDRGWREALLQTHLFGGFPRLVEALGRLASQGGIGAIDADEMRGEPDLPERGWELFQRIYAGQAQGLRGKLAQRHPELEAWVLGHAYGRVLTRPGLPADRRELLACACLAATGQERQLAAHARGALRCGATEEELREALEEISDLLGKAEQTQVKHMLAWLDAGGARLDDGAGAP